MLVPNVLREEVVEGFHSPRVSQLAPPRRTVTIDSLHARRTARGRFQVRECFAKETPAANALARELCLELAQEEVHLLRRERPRHAEILAFVFLAAKEVRNSSGELARIRCTPGLAVHNREQFQNPLASQLHFLVAAAEPRVHLRWPRRVDEARLAAHVARLRCVIGRLASQVGWQRASGSAARVLPLRV